MTERERLLETFENEGFANLTFTDDFLFYSTLSHDLRLCQELLQIILNQKIKEVKFVHTQKTLKHSYNGKGVRLDVYVDDEEQTVYDIEMQNVDNRNLPKRSRYYQGMIDLNLIKKGKDYKELKKSYIIFICMFDPFGRNLYRYEFENCCVDAPEIRLEDETTKIFLNPYGKGQKISNELRGFLEYLVTHKSTNNFTKRLDAEVKSIVENEEWRLEYMTLKMRDRENMEKGMEKGLLTGRAECVLDLLREIGEIPSELQEKIYAQNNLETLKSWLSLAKRAETIEDFQKHIE